MSTTSQNFTTIAMIVALALMLGTLTILVSISGVKAESPLVNTLATGAVGMVGAIAGLAVPKGAPDPKDKPPVTTL